MNQRIIFICFFYKFLASLKSLGDKTANLFSRKKEDVEKLAKEKADNAAKMAEEQAKAVGESVQQTKSEAENLAASTGEFCTNVERSVWKVKVSVNIKKKIPFHTS